MIDKIKELHERLDLLITTAIIEADPADLAELLEELKDYAFKQVKFGELINDREHTFTDEDWQRGFDKWNDRLN